MTDTDGFSDFSYSAKDGLRLHARIYGEAMPGALPAICLPGLTRNARDFHALALLLSRDPKTPRQVVAFDFRGRGESAYDPDWTHYDALVEADDVLAGLAAMGVEHGAFIGTSRGGLVMHVLAGMRPGVMKAGILNDVGPVIEGEGLTQIRTYLERAPKPSSWDEAKAIVAQTMEIGFPALGPDDHERATRAIYRDDNGRPVPDYDPNLLKTLTGLDLSKPLPVLWPQFIGLTAMPLMVIRGELSRLLSERTIDEMAGYAPSLERVTVAGQGHAPFLETGDLPAIIGTFLAQVDRGKARAARDRPPR
ncbi:alpha/beta hydrolase [Zhengella mangrovi]|uniref:Alpha/beta hydrolase n=1 Tax=Zhengella mangrovi TaxID=1982044 RepID=A0A2G1QSA6_9HYPH|nr:alpha/beta hydrolase [Zhengella mangrovi]PHP68427.1 alpha/beta hydrolase [Zhengella mangrovi]